MSLPKYRWISFDRQIGIGVAGSMQTAISAVAKTNVPNAPYCIPNEYICSEIARFLRLPVPPCGIIYAPTAQPSHWFASLDFNLTGNALPPVDPQKCMAVIPDECTGLLLFDILVANCDRHRGNLTVNFASSPPQMAVFDHSHALFGYVPGEGCARLSRLRDRLGSSGGSETGANRHCFLDAIPVDDYFAKWFERIEALPDFFITDVCRSVAEVGLTPDEVTSATEFLGFRRNNLRRIVGANRSEFSAIKQWRLFQ